MSDCSHCSGRGDSSGFTSGLLLGLVLGGAGGYLLTTEKGQELLDNLKENAGDKIKELIDNPAIAEKLKDLETTMNDARATLANSSLDARSKIHTAASHVADLTAPEPAPKKNFFKRMGESLGK